MVTTFTEQVAVTPTIVPVTTCACTTTTTTTTSTHILLWFTTSMWFIDHVAPVAATATMAAVVDVVEPPHTELAVDVAEAATTVAAMLVELVVVSARRQEV